MDIEQAIATSADGTGIAWYDFGGDGPELLLAHATGFCGRIWEPVVQELIRHFRCVTYDLRGHGLSSSPDYGRDGWSWDRYAEDAAAVLGAAGFSRPFGIGHSCGGATELLLEERSPTFAALYLFEPVIFPEDPPTGPAPDRDLAVRTRKRRRSFPSVEEARSNFSERGPFSTLAPQALDAYLAHGFSASADGSITLRCDPGDEAEVYVMASAHSGFVHLDRVRCPVTVARGSESNAFSDESVRAVAGRISGAEYVEFPGLGHFGPLEQPHRFAQEVLTTFGASDPSVAPPH